MVMKVMPLEERVLVKVELTQEKTKSGIYLPDTAKEKTQQGEVVEVGTSEDFDKMGIKKGVKVIFAKYAGTEIKIDNEDYLILNKTDVLAKIEK